MEIWDLFDENRMPLHKTQRRQEPMKPGEYHIVVVVCVVNSRHEILLTLRHPEKEHYPDCWENTGGSMLAGETSRQGAARELCEETGIRVREEELVLLGTVKEESAFIDFYVVKKDVALSEIVLQDMETVDAKWVTFEELKEMGETGTLAAPVYKRIKQLEKELQEMI